MKNIVETKEFIKVKNKYSIVVESINQVAKSFPSTELLIDFTGKTIVIHRLKKLTKGTERVKSASFYQETISDQHYDKNRRDRVKIVKSLFELIINRLGMVK